MISWRFSWAILLEILPCKVECYSPGHGMHPVLMIMIWCSFPRKQEVRVGVGVSLFIIILSDPFQGMCAVYHQNTELWWFRVQSQIENSSTSGTASVPLNFKLPFDHFKQGKKITILAGRLLVHNRGRENFGTLMMYWVGQKSLFRFNTRGKESQVWPWGQV